jgi:methylaspartate mutase sigma subunit
MDQNDLQPDSVDISHKKDSNYPSRNVRQENRKNIISELPHSLRVVLTGVSSDSHTWNLVFMQLLLEHMGHHVTNLGACTPDEEIIDVCLHKCPDLLVVSTVNGHGNIDGERLIIRIRNEAELRKLPVVIGGKLGIRGRGNASFSEGLLRAGFTAVFDADSSLVEFENFVKEISELQKCIPLLEVM